MANIALIVIVCILIILIIIASLYILIYYQHEEDKNTAWFPKIIVIVSFTLACLNVLMLPLDVANTNGGRNDGGFPMDELWQATFILSGIFAVTIIPFTIFYYESEDPNKDNVDQIKTAILWSLGSTIVFTIVVIIMYITLGVAQVPCQKFKAGWQNSDDWFNCINCTEEKLGIIEYRVSVALYIVSMFTFVGVILFMFFGGIGMAALPVDFFWGFKRRPRLMNKAEFDKAREKVVVRVSLLIDRGNRLQDRFKLTGGRPKSRRDRADYNAFKSEVYLLEEEWNRLNKSYNRGIGPKIATIAWGWIQLPLFFISICLSVLWLIHVIIYLMLRPPPSPFLNVMFIELDKVFGLFGTVAYGVFAFYLMLACIKGNFKFGLRIPFIFEIHPMKPHETMMNSLLFNCLLLLFCSMAIVQFCAAAFSQYTRFTAVSSLFNAGVRNLSGIKYIYLYYFYIWFCLAFITAAYLIAFPDKKKRKKKRPDDEI